MDEHIEYLLSLTPEAFEGLIRDWLTSLGWHAVTTARTGDGGVDVRAVNPDPLSGGKVVVQCKRYSPGSPVGASTVREFYGVVVHEGAPRGLLITTSSFTKDAAAFADGKPLALLDGAQVCRLLGEAGLLAVTAGSEGHTDAGSGDLLDYAYELLEDEPAEAERIALRVIRSGVVSARAWRCLAEARSACGPRRRARSAFLRAVRHAEGPNDEALALQALGEGLLLMSNDDERPLERLAEAQRLLRLAAGRSPYPNANAEYSLLCLHLGWTARVRLSRYLEDAVPCFRYGRLVASLPFEPEPPAGRRVLTPTDFEDELGRWRHSGRWGGTYWGDVERRVDKRRAECLAAGKAALSAHDWEAAADNLEYACRAAPEEASGWRWLGYASVQAGRLYPAVRAYAVYLALAPEADDAAAVETYLRGAYEEVERTWKPLDPSELEGIDGL